MQAVAGIGEALLSVRLAGAGGVVCGVATTGSLSLSLSEDALTTSRHEAGDGRVAHGHDVSLGQGLAVARLWAVAEVPRAGVAIIQNRLSLSLAVTNHGAVPRDAHLWLAWTGMMPGHPIVPAGMAGDVAVAALVRDRRAAFARFLWSRRLWHLHRRPAAARPRLRPLLPRCVGGAAGARRPRPG